MAITITANLDASGVRTGATQAADAIDGMAAQAERSGDSLEQFAAEVQGDLNALKERTRQLKAELANMGETGEGAFRQLADGAEDSARAVGKSSSAMEKIRTAGVAFLSVATAAKAAFEAGKKVVEIVDLMAENGNPAALELADSLGEVKASLLEVAEDPVFQDMLSDVADLIREEVIPLIQAIPDAWVTASNAVERFNTSVREMIGIEAEGATAALEQAQKADEYFRQKRTAQMKADKEAKKAAEELKKATEEQAKADEKAAREAERAAKDQRERLRDEQRAIDDAAKERERLAEREQQDREKRDADELAAFQRLQQAKLDTERRAIEERKRLLQGDINPSRIIGAIDPAKLREQIANQRVAADAAKNAGLDEEELAIRRRSILRRARNDFDAGRANPEEMRAAQQELAGAAVTAAELQGKVSMQTATAMREAVRELANQSDELNRLRGEFEQIKRTAAGVRAQGDRRRGQIQGAGR